MRFSFDYSLESLNNSSRLTLNRLRRFIRNMALTRAQEVSQTISNTCVRHQDIRNNSKICEEVPNLHKKSY